MIIHFHTHCSEEQGPIEDLLTAMDEQGVDMAVVSAVVGPGGDNGLTVHDSVGRVVRANPSRLVGFACVVPGTPDAADFLRHQGWFGAWVRTLVSPHAVGKRTAELLTMTPEEARAPSLCIHTQISQSGFKVRAVHEYHGDAPVGILERKRRPVGACSKSARLSRRVLDVLLMRLSVDQIGSLDEPPCFRL